MAYLLRARERRDEVLLELDAQLRDRDAWVEKEAAAAAAVQTRFRSSSSRRKFKTKRDKASMLQRIYRGYEGRRRAWEQQKAVESTTQNLLFDYFAEVIQRTFRGFHSRKVKHDFHARKKYIEEMVSKSEELQQRLNQVAQEEAKKAEEARRAQRERKVKETTTQLHYLLSTQAQRGVMNAPYSQTPTIDGVPVEAVISNNVKDYLRTHKLDVRKPVATTGGKPLKMRATLRASSPFDVAEERMRQEKKWSKLRRVDKKDFVAGTKPPQPQYQRGINDGSEYIEPRKLRLSTKEMLAKQKDKFMSKNGFRMAVKSGRLFDEED